LKDYQKPNASNVVTTEEICQVCEKGKVVTYSWRGWGSGDYRSCDNIKCDYDEKV